MRGGIFLLSIHDFLRKSLELNLFYQRIIKEHLLLIETHLPCSETAYITEARVLKASFERLLGESVLVSKGILNCDKINCSDAVTEYTLDAEKLTSRLTGANINFEITKAMFELDDTKVEYCDSLYSRVMDINKRSLNMLYQVIEFKEKVLFLKLNQKMEVLIYPEMLEHLIEEAKVYENILKNLLKNEMPKESLCDTLNFWNHIMGEHAQFVDGLLDPSEKDLKLMAREFIKKFEKLLEECLKENEKEIIRKSKDATEEIKEYKTAATIGLLNGEIKSIITPILADHILREANHYLKLLDNMKI